MHRHKITKFSQYIDEDLALKLALLSFHRLSLGFLNPDDGIDKSFRNVGKKLSLLAA